jgi:hypothetical protein
VPSLATSPLPPLCQKGERDARGDLSPQIRCTNLVWSDFGAVRSGQLEAVAADLEDLDRLLATAGEDPPRPGDEIVELPL